MNASPKVLSYIRNKDLKEGTFIFPDNITSIGDSAFYGCTSLTVIDLPDTVTSIGNEAFYQCITLSTLDIPDSVTSIGNSAFYGCTGLISITLRPGITFIQLNAFQECPNLTTIIIDTEDQVEFERVRGLLANKLKSKAITPSLHNVQRFELSEFNARTYSSRPLLPIDVGTTLFFYDELTSGTNLALTKELHKVALPMSWENLAGYKHSLREELNDHWDYHWERHQVCIYLNNYRETIKKFAPKHPSFFSEKNPAPTSAQNKAIVELYNLIERLITELYKLDRIQLSAEEKELLLTRPTLMARIPPAIQQQMGMEYKEHTVDFKHCCTMS